MPIAWIFTITVSSLAVCLSACERDALPPPSDLAAPSPAADLALPPPTPDLTSTPDAPPSAWPKRVTLTSRFGGPDEGVLLAAGTVTTAPADLALYVGKVLSLRASAPATLCAKGTFPSLAAIPGGDADCPAGPAQMWSQSVQLSAATLHTPEESRAVGLSMLVREPNGPTRYRLRLVSESYDVGVATATFDYEPAP